MKARLVMSPLVVVAGKVRPMVELDRTAPFYVAGHRGMVGSAVWRRLESQGFTSLVGRTSSELDLRDRDATFAFMRQVRPRYVVLAAARVGGILANATHPVEFLSDNLQIQVNVMDAARESGVERLLFLGSSCIYPRDCPQPIKEEYLLTGPLEPTNEAYAIAKIAGVKQVQAVRMQDGLPWISAMPTNLYGPGDNYDLEAAHVLPALIRRFHEAKASGTPSLTLWGSGTPRREFLHVDDLARACLLILERFDDASPINVGGGEELSIATLADMVRRTVSYGGSVVWDRSRPDGVPRKRLDVSRLGILGFEQRIPLAQGLPEVYASFVQGTTTGT
jgi:GDP-L-fucose synthase